MKKLIIAAILLLATNANAEEVSSAHWTVNSHNLVDGTEKTFSLTSSTININLPNNTDWKCDVESDMGKDGKAVHIIKKTDGTVVETSGIGCYNNDQFIWIQAICLVVYKGIIVPAGLHQQDRAQVLVSSKSKSTVLSVSCEVQ